MIPCKRYRQAGATRRRCAVLGLILLLGGCSIEDSSIAEDAKTQLVGLSELDLHLCAGPPSRIEIIDGVKLATYETSSSPPNLSVSLPTLGPLLGGGVSLSGSSSSYCRAIFALVDGRVVALRYAGATEVGFGSLAQCSSIVRHCLADRPDGDLLTKNARIESAPGEP